MRKDTKQLIEAAVKGLQDKKAVDIVTIDLSQIENTFCKHFIICHGTSNTHVGGLADSVIDTLIEDCKEKPFHKEGFENSQWILLDYSDVIVHIFQKEYRDHYQLESMWSDAKINHIEEPV
eukprot:Anaeramoba_ignava/a365740_4.p1 GENE.a365740_4~~a365740_4.p1  ORF type:complete len:121 (-),score=5.56 a365740_4:36-398(-)